VRGLVAVTGHERLEVFRADLPASLAAEFSSVRRLAWDVETTGLDWRKDRLATCQLFAEETGPAVVSMDPEDGPPPGLAALLADPDVEKVFHHAPFDLRFMMHAWGIGPQSIRCTKVASKLLTPEAPNGEHSLKDLLARYLNVEIGKGSVRTSDWTRPDLTAEQLAYAVDDVRYLLPLLDALTRALAGVGRSGLYDDCCTFLPARVTLELGEYPDVFAY
jgi:ribonuclease D